MAASGRRPTFRSASVTWTNLNQTFGTAEVYAPFGMDPTNPNRSFGGLQDNETIIYSGESGVGGDGDDGRRRWERRSIR